MTKFLIYFRTEFKYKADLNKKNYNKYLDSIIKLGIAIKSLFVKSKIPNLNLYISRIKKNNKIVDTKL